MLCEIYRIKTGRIQEDIFMRNRENYILGRIQWFVIGIGFFAASMSVFVLTGEGGIRRRVFALILLGAFLVFLYYGYQKIY